jgi:translation initiation factor 1
MSRQRERDRVSTEGATDALSQNPFGALESSGLPPAPVRSGLPETRKRAKASGPTKRGRVDVRREKAGRGGKTVTVVQGFQKISRPEIENLLRELKKRTGSGGTLKAGSIELQGDRCEMVMEFLTGYGFRPVRTGG